MTDREKAVVMAYTGVTMLTGDKLDIFYKYIEELLGHPVMTHELADQDIQDEIARKSKEDFIALCRDDTMECGITDVLLDKLCEWLDYHAGKPLDCVGEQCIKCKFGVADNGNGNCWKAMLTKWMVKQDATN